MLPRYLEAVKTPSAKPSRIEDFRRWMMASVSTPPVRKGLSARVALHNPDKLSEMVEVICEIELASLTRFGAFNRRAWDERRRPDVKNVETCVSVEEFDETTDRWHEGIKWSQDIRIYLRTESLQNLPAPDFYDARLISSVA